MTSKVLVRNVAKAFVLTCYLHDLRKAIGEQAYMTSFVRSEHGPGTGFFGVGNTGSNDCLKETLRGITDGLDLRFNTFKRIPYVSASCLNLAVRTKEVHRIEHTLEISAQYHDLERRFILEGQAFTPNSLGRWFIENQIVCLIEKAEQTGKYSPEMPFGKYSSPIFYRGRDVSSLPHSAIREINLEEFSDELALVEKYDFEQAVLETKAKLIQLRGKHRLPPLELAITLANDEMNLLHQHYVGKISKVTAPGNRYYNKDQADRWMAWSTARASQSIQASPEF